MAADEEQVFDPDFLQRLRTLFFKLRRRRMLSKKGVQQTQAVGFTREFKDYRHYTRSDDFRAIDWRLFARVERLFVKLYEEIQEFHVHILVDTSRSMIEPYPRKRVATLRLAVALAYLGLMNQHRVSLSTFGSAMKLEVPPLKGPGHIHRILQHVTGLEFDGMTDLESLRQFRPSRGRRGIVFILSDLLGGEPEASAEALQVTTSWPAEVHVVHVLEPEEMRPTIDGEVRLIDVETQAQRQLTLTRRDMERYAAAFDKYLQDLGQSCLRRKVDYVTWRTDLAFEKLFLELLSRGSALSQG
ncbi:MAG: DUF58 domain-containing protein [Planctomycetota bacterium]|nr:DUF58 domain-containing protein [Planctomycetota bacterium]